jgi:hypothetical protein
MCQQEATSTFTSPKDPSTGISKWMYDSSTNVCTIQFDIPSDMAQPVYMYYRLTNFYQNNRKYVKSFDLAQLGGSAVYPSHSLDSNCDPLRTNPNDYVFSINGRYSL